MEINSVNTTAAETVPRADVETREPTQRPENTEQTTNRPAPDGFQVEISTEARARLEANEEELQAEVQQQQNTATYNSSGEIGG